MSERKRTNWFQATVALLLLAGGASAAAQDRKSRENPSIGERFHEETRVTWRGIIGDLFRSKPPKPSDYKEYPQAKRITLPPPEHRGLTVEEALRKRRSVRNYSDRPMTLPELSQLLFAAQGVTGRTFDHLLRTVPSAGALYPYEIYVVALSVDSLPPGVYHYSVRDHQLEQLKTGDFRGRISSAALEQDMMAEADVVFVLSAIFDRTRSKYGERGFRYVYIEAGHISQNIYLQAVSLGLGSVAVGAFHDGKVNELIGVDGRNEAAIYLHAVGTR